MKKIIKKFVVPSLLLLLVFTSCQQEIDVVGPEDNALSEENIVANSEVANLITQTSANDGSADNIIDGASCIDVVFPITVNVNGVEITLDSEMDLRIIEEIFDEFEDDDDVLEIIFPITITTGDFSEVVINDEEALEEFVEECIEGGDDDDIECIDFQFPLTFFQFNVETQQTDQVIVENDRQLHLFFANLEEGDIVSIQYPVTLILFDGTEVVVDSNEQLARALAEARDLCDEDDDDDFNDDDFSLERLNNFLEECPFIVNRVRRDNEDLDDIYESFLMNFSDDGSVTVRTRGGQLFEGEWDTRITVDGAVLVLEFPELSDFTFVWFVNDIDGRRIQLFGSGGNRILMTQACEENDISVERVENFLQECFWRVARLQIDGTDEEDQFLGTPIRFGENGNAFLRINGEFVQGSWDVLEANAGFVLQLNFENRPDLNLFWLIIRLEEDRLLLVNETSQLILVRILCEDEEDGDVIEIGSILNQGEWVVANYIDNGQNETENFSGFVVGFNEDGGAFAEGQGQNIEGSWLLRRGDDEEDDDEGLKFELNFELETLFAELNNDWHIVEVDENRIELHAINDDDEDPSEDVLVFERR